jgi:hypothetical protein
MTTTAPVHLSAAASARRPRGLAISTPRRGIFSTQTHCAGSVTARTPRGCRQEMGFVPPSANVRMKRSRWDKVPFDATAAGRLSWC